MRVSSILLTIVSAASAMAYAHGNQQQPLEEHNCKEYLRSFLRESLQAIPPDTESGVVRPQESCDTFQDCGFCGFYERCCYKKDGHDSPNRGYCTCGVSGKEKYCA